jgi:hypothetical protein
LVFAATLVLGWIVPLVLSYAIRPLATLMRGSRRERPERTYLIVKYLTFAVAIVAYGALVWSLTRLRGVVAWPSWGAFIYSTLGALSAISDADRQAWADARRGAGRPKLTLTRVVRRTRRQNP